MIIMIIIRNLFHALFILFAVSTITFGLLYVSGDPVLLLLPPDALPEEIKALRETMGLNDPLHIQYIRFLGKLVRCDLGHSFFYKESALKLLLERTPATLELACAAMIFAMVIAIPLGILSAVKYGTGLDNLSLGLATIGQAVPIFWLGLMLMLVFSVSLGWLPTSGRGNWNHLILPASSLGAYPMAAIVRLLRANLLTALRMDYITVARAKGIREFWVVTKHALKNAAIPVVTLIGLQLGTMLGGTIVVETIFAWPGIGRLTIFAIYHRDFPLVQASVIYLAAVFVILNLITDLTYRFLDPRVRVGRAL